jgi:hypothetical protein
MGNPGYLGSATYYSKSEDSNLTLGGCSMNPIKKLGGALRNNPGIPKIRLTVC